MSFIAYLTAAESKDLLRAAPTSRDSAIIAVMIYAGLFLNEVTHLEISDIDWSAKVLKIKGTRARELPINEPCYQALAQWSKDRLDCQSTKFFTTTKGPLEGLSERSIDHLIRTAAKKAGIDRGVNAHMLRNTFAVQLCQEEPDTSKRMKILGLHDPDTLKRYELSEITPIKQPWISRLKTLFFPITPKTPKQLSMLEGFLTPDPQALILGREGLLTEIRSALKRHQPVLLTGPFGIGKTHILKHLASTLPKALYVQSPIPTKSMLMTLYESCTSETVNPRTSIQDLLTKLTQTKEADRPLLILDNFQRFKKTDLDLMVTLTKTFTLLTAADNHGQFFKTQGFSILQWKFKTLEVLPLSETPSRTLIDHLTQNIPVADRALLHTKVLGLADGNPLAIVDMIQQLHYRPTITSESVRDLNHSAGTTYRDWTFLVTVLWAILVGLRFVALGVHSFEGYILAGFGTSIFIIAKVATRKGHP